jgi:hypothetical protein
MRMSTITSERQGQAGESLAWVRSLGIEGHLVLETVPASPPGPLLVPTYAQLSISTDRTVSTNTIGGWYR